MFSVISFLLIFKVLKCVTFYQIRIGAGHQWLMPVILAIQEAEIRRIMV
jgi:hypothetical protein